MQFAWTAIVVHAIGQVAILLRLKEDRSWPDRVDGSRIHENQVALRDRQSQEAVFQRSIVNAGSDLVQGHARFEPGRYLRSRFGGEYIPALCFSAWLAVFLGHLVVGMDLNAQFLAGENHF